MAVVGCCGSREGARGRLFDHDVACEPFDGHLGGSVRGNLGRRGVTAQRRGVCPGRAVVWAFGAGRGHPKPVRSMVRQALKNRSRPGW